MQITLIDQNEQFVFKPLLYELINGGATPEEVAPLFADLLAPMKSTSFIKVFNCLYFLQSNDGTHSTQAQGPHCMQCAGQCSISTYR